MMWLETLCLVLPTTTPHTAFKQSVPTSVQAQQLDTVHNHGNLNHNHATVPTTSHWTCHVINHLMRGRRIALDPHLPTQREPAASPVTPFLPLPSLRDVGIQPCHYGRSDHDSGAVYPWQRERGVAKVRESGGQWTWAVAAWASMWQHGGRENHIWPCLRRRCQAWIMFRVNSP